MPFDGNGTYSPPSAPNFPAIPGTVVASSYYNVVINDIATALSNCLTKDGQSLPSAAQNWNNKNLTNVATFGAVAGQFSGLLTANAGATFVGTVTVNGSTIAATASPAFTGVPTAPTAANGTNTTQIATTAFVLANLPSLAGYATEAYVTSALVPYATTASVAATLASYATTAALNAALAVLLPTGSIIMWSGSIASIPAGWALCNGAGGTPDLRDRMVIGAGSTYAVAATGGGTTHTHTLAIASSSTGASVGTTSNTVDGSGGFSVLTAASLTDPGHNHTGSADASSNMPPYYALAYIMKV